MFHVNSKNRKNRRKKPMAMNGIYDTCAVSPDNRSHSSIISVDVQPLGPTSEKVLLNFQ